MESAAIDFDRLERLARQLHPQFAAADPFPHAVIEDFLPVETARGVLEEFRETGAGWNHYHHYNEKKLAITRTEAMGERTQELFEALQSPRFVGIVEALTGIDDLLADPDLDGAGLHQILPGGFLNVHTDFLSHTRNRHWSRQVNLLLYLNERWEPGWKGDLELWDADMSRCVQSIAPLFNRCVIFHTRPRSFHGHPHKLACPPGESRKSIALYYFRDEHRTLQLTPTNYRARPDDPPIERLLVAADRQLLRVYSFLKRYAGVSDGLVSRILRRF